MVFLISLGMALVSSSTILWVYAVMRLSLFLLVIIAAVRLSDRSIQKTLKRAQTQWNPVYENYVPQPSQGASYWRNPEALNMPKLRRRGANSIYVITGMIVTFLLGIGSREAWLLTASSHLDHAKVTQQISDKEFMFQDPVEGKVHGIFCQVLPFKEGMRVSIKFESHLYCWSVRENGLKYFIEQGAQEDGWNTYTNPNPHANPFTVAYTNPTR